MTRRDEIRLAENATKARYRHQAIAILGYICGVLGGLLGIAGAFFIGVLGGLLGLVIGILLLTRRHPRAKFHGKIILIVTVIVMAAGIAYSLA